MARAASFVRGGSCVFDGVLFLMLGCCDFWMLGCCDFWTLRFWDVATLRFFGCCDVAFFWTFYRPLRF
jgi:hypothetical protein